MVERKAPQTSPSVARGRLRALLLAAIALLYVLSVPWYRPLEAAPPMWLGLPSWVTTAVLCYFAAAVLNAIARVYLGAHNPLDVVGGGAIGVAIGVVLVVAFGLDERLRRSQPER